MQVIEAYTAIEVSSCIYSYTKLTQEDQEGMYINKYIEVSNRWNWNIKESTKHEMAY